MALETQLKEALVKQRADELYQKFSFEPQYKIMIGEFVEELGNSMIESIATSMGDLKPDEKDEMLEEYRAKVLPQLRTQFDNPEQLRQIFTEQARNQYMISDELRAKMAPQFKEMKEDEDFDIDDEAMTNFERTYEKIFKYAEENDKILNKLSEIAKAEGLEKAIQKETIYEIIRERFPTPESFREYSLRTQENIKSLFQEMPGTLMADGEVGKFMGGMIGAIGSAMEKMMKVGEKLTADYLDRTIQEIYNPQTE
ncbi:hypothetical protein CMI39_03040 [Candidatus Pacearchaeota archaeon]|jgi:hypothetical protein|nr:hypothetical protein [Candidatus Pacearchaeota archaeon]|tara:strand:- start:382 stop:1146 length:765 start_codon:yes stop_codon:yes gene_type:complete